MIIEKQKKIIAENEENDLESNLYFYHPDHASTSLSTSLGSTGFVTNANAKPVQHLQYLPFGELFVSDATGDFDSRYKFSGKELDDETGYNYFGARYYDSDLSNWISVDPSAEKYPSLSPYNYCANNPVILVDPNGTSINPVYDYDGNFLGTDDKGLQGEAIFMDKSDFEQGMAHGEAMKVGKTLDNMSEEDALKLCTTGNFSKFLNHYNNLKNRIDYSPDFVLTKEIADKYWQSGTEDPLFVNMAKIDLPGVTVKDFDKNGFYSKNFIWGLSNTGKVYGTLDMTLLDAKTGKVKIGYVNPHVSPNGLVMDRYDFTYDGRWLRDFATWCGKPSGNGKDFDIHGYGYATIPLK